MINYMFGLFDKNGKLIDTTEIDENNPEFAMTLFEEFSATEEHDVHDGSGHTVKLMQQVSQKLDFEAVIRNISIAMEELDGNIVAKIHNQICMEKIRYVEDSLWEVD